MKCLLSLALLVGCGASSAAAPTAVVPTAGPLTRPRFNQLAVRLNLALYWEEDRDGDGEVDVDEIRTLRFHGPTPTWVEAGRATEALRQAIAAIEAAHVEPAPADRRLALVHRELTDLAPTLLHADLRALPEPHRAFARHMLRAGELVDRLYAEQVGMTAVAASVSPDPASRSLFRRNWGPSCLGPSTEGEAACSAIPGAPAHRVGIYPAAVAGEPDFCDALAARPDADALLSPFAAVRARGDALVAVPYSRAYPELMASVAAELRAAADAISADPSEARLVEYLRAAAQAHEDDDWPAADEAWARMDARSSRWYVRIGPDEVYWDPCARKAGFHMTLALIDPGSLQWQDRLGPLRDDMERAIAALAPEHYRPRPVSFDMPDFIRVVANSGDDRAPFGATLGQSLPNWGPVSDEGRGRTVAMTNIYTDADSRARHRATASSLLSPAMMAQLGDEPEAMLVGTVLHEATHNLGPSSEHLVGGRSDEEIFGGPMASMLEELKAQSGALFLLELVQARGVIDADRVRQAYVGNLTWALGHISRGMYTPEGGRKAYSQLSAIQIGYLMEAGALRFDADTTAANGEDRGAFVVDFDRLPAAVRELMAAVVGVKAAGDVAEAERLVARYVDGDVVPMALITERFRRQPAPTFVYAIDLD